MTKACFMAAFFVLLSFSQATQAAQLSVQQMSLPPARLDSFVHQALISGHAEHIYGDESVEGPPPQMGFNVKHRINIGITGETDRGLTTGHGSYLPDAWGSDEFLRAPGAHSLSGRNDGDHHYNGIDGNADSDANSEPSPLAWSDGGAAGSGAGSAGGNGAQALPDPPGEGFQPMYQHGQFVGWYTPDQVARAQTDFPSVLREVVNGPYYYGGESGRASILYEIGDISSPF